MKNLAVLNIVIPEWTTQFTNDLFNFNLVSYSDDSSSVFFHFLNNSTWFLFIKSHHFLQDQRKILSEYVTYLRKLHFLLFSYKI